MELRILFSKQVAALSPLPLMLTKLVTFFSCLQIEQDAEEEAAEGRILTSSAARNVGTDFKCTNRELAHQLHLAAN